MFKCTQLYLLSGNKPWYPCCHSFFKIYVFLMMGWPAFRGAWYQHSRVHTMQIYKFTFFCWIATKIPQKQDKYAMDPGRQIHLSNKKKNFGQKWFLNNKIKKNLGIFFKKIFVKKILKNIFQLQVTTLREEIFAGRKFREYRELWPNSRK